MDRESNPETESPPQWQDLFDLSTVEGKYNDDLKDSELNTTYVTVPRVLLSTIPGDGISITEDTYVLYETARKKLPPLNDWSSCGSIMSNNIDERDIIEGYYNEYDEKLANTTKLGKYPKKILPPLYWAPSYQNYTRKMRLLRHCCTISETVCIVDVYGYGINGRLFSAGGPNSGKSLIIQAYSKWNSKKHEIYMDIMDVKRLLIDHVDLFKPGHKKNLLMLLIKHLYFTYTIKTYPLPEDPPDAQLVTEQVVTHLEPPVLRNHDKYPQSVIEIMDFMNFDHSDSLTDGKTLQDEVADDVTVSTLGSGTLGSVKPTHIQHLVTISEELKMAQQPVQGSGRDNRRVARKLKEKLELEEQERQRLAWLAIPKRKRGLKCCYCFRGKGRLFVLAAYISPLRPATVSVKGYHPLDCSKIVMSLGLTLLGTRYKIIEKPATWQPELLDKIVRKSVQQIRAGGCFAGENQRITKLMLDGYGGIETELCAIKTTCQTHIANVTRKRERILDLHPGHYYNEQHTEKLNNPEILPLVDRRRYLPARDMGKGLRVYSRVRNIHGVRCILSIHVGSAKLIRGAIPNINDEPDNQSTDSSQLGSSKVEKKDDNKNEEEEEDEDEDEDEEDEKEQKGKEKPYVIDAAYDNIDSGSKVEGGSMGTTEEEMKSILRTQNFITRIADNFSIEVTIYVPHDAHYDSYLIPACTKFKASLVKDDLYRLLTNREQFFYCMNVCYFDFVHSADANEWQIMETAWNNIADELVAKSRWGLRYASNGPIEDNLSNIHKAEALLSIDATIVKPGNEPASDMLIWPPIPEVVLSWPALYYRKLIKIPSQVKDKPDPKFVTDIWYKYKRMGVICYDAENMDAYFVDLPDAALQATILTQHFSPFDKSLSLSIFLQSSIVYVEKKDENGDVYNEVVYNDGDIDLEMSDDILEDDAAYEEAIAASIENRPQNNKKKIAEEEVYAMQEEVVAMEEEFDMMQEEVAMVQEEVAMVQEEVAMVE